MVRRRPAATVWAAVVAAAALGAAGCSNGGSASDAASRAASAVRSAGAEVSAAATHAADAAASAAAEARKKLDDVKGGVDAKGAVTLGKPSTAADGHTEVPVTVENTDGAAKSFAVQVDFRDGDGNTVDTVVVTVQDVAAKGRKEATARSTHELSGSVSAQTARALRY
ncbi:MULTISPECIES: FxLYD domain-containing protein [Streptomyces]|uniref:FxLYD domain-containing protein n=1 Tax=Streptomyces TaxID=1883 RepID=UPI000F743BCB|nr:FxLYD domain-containing protein [Streptomyces sp. WAC05292]RSS83563.1 hypothetical protein EF903_25515 [Streptomyces sp. WAC05292]